MATQAPGGLDFEAMRQAIEGRDAETLAGFPRRRRRDTHRQPQHHPQFSPGAQGQGGDLRVPARRLRPGDDSPRRERGRGGEPHRVQRGVRVPGRDPRSGRRDARVSRWQDRAPGERGGLGRVAPPRKTCTGPSPSLGSGPSRPLRLRWPAWEAPRWPRMAPACRAPTSQSGRRHRVEGRLSFRYRTFALLLPAILVLLVRLFIDRRPLLLSLSHTSPLWRAPGLLLRLGSSRSSGPFITAGALCSLGWHHEGARG
jgi:hypothetical protein